MELGIDVLQTDGFKMLKGMDVGLCTNFQATDSRLRPTVEIFHKNLGARLKMIFAPEHGFFSALQDQIGERDSSLASIPVSSLYGRKFSPSDRDCRRVDALVIDLMDIGTRYYTFAWTAMLCIEKFARHRKKVFVLDRPNPLNGVTLEGPVLDPAFCSFVGLYPVPVRHGMTIAELCRHLNSEHGIGCDLRIVRMKGWQRAWYHDKTGLAWTSPSPNMPTLDTALVYPGMCLLEGTNVSEGRGTTRPFEIFGAPWIDPPNLVKKLERIFKEQGLRGARFRPVFFKPTFGKFAGTVCGGCQIHMTDRERFKPFISGLAVIKTVRDLYSRSFRWRRPPYEREKRKLPFDILCGNAWIRALIEKPAGLSGIEKRWRGELNDFRRKRAGRLLYT